VHRAVVHRAVVPPAGGERVPPEADAEFARQMEDALAVYTRPHDPARPVVCLDETSRQLLAEARPPLPPGPGRPARPDPEHARGGVANRCLVAEPRRGWRAVRASEQRTRLAWAHGVRDLVGVHYPDAERVVLVLDQLATHSPASLSEAFPPAEAKRLADKAEAKRLADKAEAKRLADKAEAKRLADKREIHFTPTHGSWLNMAELEPSALQRQCLDRRLADRPPLEREVAARAAARNAADAAIDRRFTTADARITLTRRYPAVDA
jgi:hypothetical protein